MAWRDLHQALDDWPLRPAAAEAMGCAGAAEPAVTVEGLDLGVLASDVPALASELDCDVASCSASSSESALLAVRQSAKKKKQWWHLIMTLSVWGRLVMTLLDYDID